MKTRRLRVAAIAATVVVLLASVGVVVGRSTTNRVDKVHVVGYFPNSTGLFVGDEVRILGVRVGAIDKIEPQGTQVKISFWYDRAQNVPAEAKAVILSPALVPVRAIQLTPAYTGGPVMTSGAVIPQNRTAVPVEWDDVRQQLKKLTATLEPTQPGGVSTLGALVDTAADNMRGQGASMRQSLIELSQAMSALGDHSDDIFSTVKNLSILVSALKDSAAVIRRLNSNLAEVTGALSDTPNEIGAAVHDINDVVGDVQQFVAANRETFGTTTDKLASVTTALAQSLDDLKQTLHLAPNTFQNFVNIYHPAQGGITGTVVINTFSNPITFICGAIEAASRLGAEQSAKLCAQYLAPIVKNRQYNFPPIGMNPIIGATARPNELTYSEDWMRPDYVPPQPAASAPPGPAPAADAPLLAAEAPGAATLNPQAQQANTGDGLRGLMMPQGGRS
jgi:phospholipid/cholesterol/gamma-HCH transport system substrate-binding protein